MLRIAVLASGRGSNLQALIDAIGAGQLDATIAGVFSDKADALALQRARRAQIPALAVNPGDFRNRLGFDEHMFSAVDAVQPDVIVFAGYMRLVSQREVDARAGCVLNIHPSLLPAFKGLRTHDQALAAGVSEHGASVHVVSADLDAGPVIAQARVPVLAGDDAATLGQRVIAREHPLLVQTLRWLAAGRIKLTATSVEVDRVALAAPLQLGADNRLEIQ